MSRQDDGGPAFPTDCSYDANFCSIKGGMSLRDYFAGQALVALANDWQSTPEIIVTRCYRMADAMLAERAK